VATSAPDQLPDFPGLVERWGIDVLHCPYCPAMDAVLVRGTSRHHRGSPYTR
jgi:hypothetical protein